MADDPAGGWDGVTNHFIDVFQHLHPAVQITTVVMLGIVAIVVFHGGPAKIRELWSAFRGQVGEAEKPEEEPVAAPKPAQESLDQFVTLADPNRPLPVWRGCNVEQCVGMQTVAEDIERVEGDLNKVRDLVTETRSELRDDLREDRKTRGEIASKTYQAIDRIHERIDGMATKREIDAVNRENDRMSKQLAHALEELNMHLRDISSRQLGRSG